MGMTQEEAYETGLELQRQSNIKDLSRHNKKLKNVRNIYFCYREIDTTLEYSIICNVQEGDKSSLVYDKEKQGFEVVKILCNE